MDFASVGQDAIDEIEHEETFEISKNLQKVKNNRMRVKADETESRNTFLPPRA